MHKMNSKKSADYCKLIENVKNKYRKNPIYAKNLTLGWCDLRRGEDCVRKLTYGHIGKGEITPRRHHILSIC